MEQETLCDYRLGLWVLFAFISTEGLKMKVTKCFYGVNEVYTVDSKSEISFHSIIGFLGTKARSKDYIL